MEILATQKQLNYLSYLIKDFKPSDALTIKEASIMISKALKEKKTSKAKKAPKKEVKKEAVNKYGVKVGDVFGFSYGYDATYYAFFEVIRLVGSCSVEVCEIAKKHVEGGYSALDWNVKPCKGAHIVESHFLDGKTNAVKKIVPMRYDNNKPSIAIRGGYYHARLCDADATYSEDDYH